MRRALEFLVTRALRSRLGLAVAIGAVVFAVIGAARLVAGPVDSPTGIVNRPSRPISTVDPGAGHDGIVVTEPPPSPVTSPGAMPPDVAATRFTSAWLGGTGQSGDEWRAAMQPLATTALMAKLAGADPAGVPAERVTGDVSVRPQTASFVEVLVPLDTGRLRLELVAPEGRWLVDAVDWERA